RAQPEDPLQYLYGFAYSPGVGIGAKKPPWPAGTATVVGDARRLVIAELQIGVRLVIAKQYVVAWLELLDQVVFKQQGLSLCPGNRDFHPDHFGHHVGDTRAGRRFLKI